MARQKQTPEEVAPRTLVADVHVVKPADEDGQGGDTVAFVAGTRETDMPEWAVAGIGNPHAWSDSQRDERVEFIVAPRLAAYGAPAEMVDEVVSTLGELRKTTTPEQYETAVREMLRVTNDASLIADAIVDYRQHNVVRGGETYVEYRARCAELGADPVPFDEFLAAGSGGLIVETPEAGAETVLRGGETFEQYEARAAVAGEQPVELDVWLAGRADVASGYAETAAEPAPVERAAQPVVERQGEQEAAQQPVVERTG